MRKRVIRTAAITLAVILAVCGTSITVSGATVCSVKYYYTSSQNPEGVPASTTGVLSGSKWKIRPAGPTRTVYTKSRNGKTMTYTFDGWYTNINCLGTRYAPGKETTSLTPASSSGKYTLILYGRWKYSESGGTTTAKTTAPKSAKGATAAPAKNTAPTVAKSTAPASGKSTTSSGAKNTTPAMSATSPTNSAAPSAATEPKAEAPKTEKPVTVSVMKKRSREEVLAGWRHLLIDTFFYINGRQYRFAEPCKYWKNSKGEWSGRTGTNGKTQTCLTLPNVSLKRAGLLAKNNSYIYLSSNMAKTPNKTAKKLKKTSKVLTIFYPHKSLKYMAAKGMVKYGDILCRSGHTFVYMGKDSKGHPLIYEGGTVRDIGNGTRVVWGHNSHGRGHKLTGKINKQIKRSDAVGKKWRKGKISDAAFKGHKASGNNLNKPVHVVCSINTFTIKTRCTNGTISSGSIYMAGQNVTVKYAPSKGKKLNYIQVDGKKKNASKYASKYTFKKLSANHWINVVYK